MVDFIVVGAGLSGLAFCQILEAREHSFILVDDQSQQASLVAAGVYNPVVLKRFTLAWRAPELLDFALPFYKQLEEKLNVSLDEPFSILRVLHSVEEQNMWFEAADKPGLDRFMIPKLNTYTNPHIRADYGFGELQGTGKINTSRLISSYKDYLRLKGHLVETTVKPVQLNYDKTGVQFGDHRAKFLVFAEGYGLVNNPWFNYLPLNGTKGEILQLYAPELKESHIIKSGVFLSPLGEDLYQVGATYKWKDKTNSPTAEAREELLSKLGKFMLCDYKVESHFAGIRPTVTDRRPLVGIHPKYSRMAVLNGMGSRGVMNAPFTAQCLYNKLIHGKDLPAEIDIARFENKLKSANVPVLI